MKPLVITLIAISALVVFGVSVGFNLHGMNQPEKSSDIINKTTKISQVNLTDQNLDNDYKIIGINELTVTGGSSDKFYVFFTLVAERGGEFGYVASDAKVIFVIKNSAADIVYSQNFDIHKSDFVNHVVSTIRSSVAPGYFWEIDQEKIIGPNSGPLRGYLTVILPDGTKYAANTRMI